MKNLIFLFGLIARNFFFGGNPKAVNPNALNIDDSVDCGNGCSGCNVTPSFDWEISAGYPDENGSGWLLTVTSTTTYDSGDSEDKIFVYVKQGDGDWTWTEANPATLDISSLDPQKEFMIRMKVVTSNGCVEYVDAVVAAGWNREQEGIGNWASYPPY